VTSWGSGGGWSDPGLPGGADPDSSLPDLPDSERYELVDLIGVGGMGRVFRAFDRRLGRTVALKEVSPELAGTAVAERLAVEALLTADLEHPGIVSVHDAGRTDDGRLYYTMRLVRGRSLAQELEAASTPEQHAALVRHLLDACHAVGYAHSRGILHRDLKPSNIMVGEFGETQVVDWGLARRMDGGVVEGRSAGTSGYMSPEAADGGKTDARSDVWSLGSTLRDVMGPNPAPDLAAIAARALTEDPADRYVDAHALAIDLQRFLDGRRVSAYEYSPAELLRRLIRAWRAPLAVAGVAGLVVVFVVGSAWLRTTQARDRAVVAEGETRTALVRSDRHLASSLEAQAAAALQEGRYPAAEVLAARALLIEESATARGVLLAGGALHRPTHVEVTALPACDWLQLQGEAMLCFSGGSLRYLEGLVERWAHPTTALHGRLVGDHVVLMHPAGLMEVWSRADGSSLATFADTGGGPGMRGRADGKALSVANGLLLTVVDLEALTARTTAVCPNSAPAFGSVPDVGRSLVLCRGHSIEEVDDAGERRTFASATPGIDEPRSLLLAEGLLYGGTVHGEVVVWDAETGDRLSLTPVLEGPVDTLLPLDGSRLVAVAGGRGGVRLWNLDAAVEVLRLPAPTRALTQTGPGELLVASEELRRWTLPATTQPSRLISPVGLSCVASSPDGRYLAGARGDGTLQVWSVADGGIVAEYKWQERVLKWAAFSPSGDEVLASGLGENSIRRWSTKDWSPLPTLRSPSLRRLGKLADGRTWGLSYSPHLHLVAGEQGSRVPMPAPPFDGAMAPSGTDLIILDEIGGVSILASGADSPTPLFDRPSARGVAVDEAGTIAIAHERHVELVDRTGVGGVRLEAGEGGVIDVALSADGRWAAAGMLDGTARLWSVSDRRLVATLAGHSKRVGSVHFTADSQSLVTGDWAGVVRRWSLADAVRPASELVAEVESGWQMEFADALTAGR